MQLPTPLVSVQWLIEHINHPDLVILDATLKKPGGIAPPVESKVHLPGARFFDIKNTFSDLDSELPNTLPDPEAFSQAAQTLGISNSSLIVVYDAWGIYSSARAWWMFHIMGHEQVAVLDGGLPAWQQAGMMLSTEISNPSAPGDFQAKFRPQLIKYTQDIIENLKTEEALVLDARSNGRFHATAPEPRAGLRGGHIPKSKSLPISEVLENGKMKSKAQLQSIFQSLNADNQPIICSCGSGVTAALIYLAAQLAGSTSLGLYDGSWTEYAQRLDLPVHP